MFWILSFEVHILAKQCIDLVLKDGGEVNLYYDFVECFFANWF